MTLSQAIISGIVQGITEFFPISSSGHLVLMHSFFGLKEPQVAFDVFLHLGTLLSILVFFRKDLIDLVMRGRKTLVLLIVASIPTFAIAILFKDAIESIFTLPVLVGYMMLVNGSWLIFANWCEKRLLRRDLGVMNSIIIGIGQGIAIIPGISRSGTTISTGMIAGLNKEAAFKFSFLLAIPAILGAMVFKAHSLMNELTGNNVSYFIVGGFVAAVTGFFAVSMLLKIVRRDRFYLFGFYCIVVGLLSVLYFK